MDDYTPRKAAVLASRAGICVVPPLEDGSKRPMTEWKEFQSTRPSRDTLQRWYTSERTGIGAVCGAVSGNLEMLELEDAGLYRTFHDTAEAAGLDHIIDRIADGYAERTPGGGIHWLYRCDEIAGNTKLASRPNPDQPKNPIVLIETRGEGGYVILAPSFGPVHPSGEAYTLISGGFDTIATITPEERAELFRLAAAFDELPKDAAKYSENHSSDRAGTRPGDDYNVKTRWSDILEPHGWKRIFSHNGVDYWRRPGKDRGISATTNYQNSDLLYVFTTSTMLESERSYDRFGAYAFLEHNGDFRTATETLVKEGYGEKLAVLRLVDQHHEAQEGNAPEPESLSDLGNARRLVRLFGSEFRWCDPWSKWLVYDGARWRLDDTRAVHRFAKETVRSIYAEAKQCVSDGDRKETGKHALRSEGRARIEAMLELAKSEPGIPILPAGLDADHMKFNALNGTIDLRTGQLLEHNRADFITKIAPVDYNPDARLDLWQHFLDEATEFDDGTQDFLQRAAGYSLTGDTREEKLFFIHGPTNSGKSTYLEAIKRTLGDYAATADFETFLQRRDVGNARPDIARLAGVRLVASIEVDDGKKLAEGLIKMLTGGDTITARRLYQDEFEFKPAFKLWLAANHAPRVADDDDAMWRRIVRVPFEYTVPVDRRDPRVKEQLTNSAIAGSAILCWLVQGCLKWQAKGLTVSERIEQATAQYRADMDPIADFIEALCVTDSEAWTSSKALRHAYEEWGKEEGVTKQLIGGRAFGERMRARGCTPKPAWIQGKQQRGWLGIGLKGVESQHTFGAEL